MGREFVIFNNTFHYFDGPFLVAEGMFYGCKVIVCPDWFKSIIFLENSFLWNGFEGTIILFKKTELLANKVRLYDRESPETT